MQAKLKMAKKNGVSWLTRGFPHKLPIMSSTCGNSFIITRTSTCNNYRWFLFHSFSILGIFSFAWCWHAFTLSFYVLTRKQQRRHQLQEQRRLHVRRCALKQGHMCQTRALGHNFSVLVFFQTKGKFEIN